LSAELPSYALVTPTHNEEENLPRLADSVLAQSVRPVSWVIVDDGSTDRTQAVAGELAGAHPWVRLMEVPAAAGAVRGGPIVRSFTAGERTVDPKVEVVVKVDADVSMDGDYFERLLAAFAADARLGIASGTAYEWENGEWRQRFATGTSVWGAVRAYRRPCLAEISPLIERMGWDTVDEHKARNAGWGTITIHDLPFRHHRAEGGRDPSRYSAWRRQGDLAYYLGYRPSYLVLRTLYHLRGGAAALGLPVGYLASLLRRAEQCQDPAVKQRVQEMQRLRSLRRRVDEKSGRVLSPGD
jgi:glycosyltransferase involved in cell wall biosynthesis